MDKTEDIRYKKYVVVAHRRFKIVNGSHIENTSRSSLSVQLPGLIYNLNPAYIISTHQVYLIAIVLFFSCGNISLNMGPSPSTISIREKIIPPSLGLVIL